MLNNKKIQCVGINSAGIVIVRDESITLNKFAPDVVSLLDSKATKMELQTGLGTKADKEYNSGFIGGKNAKLNAVGGVAAGLNAQASSGSATGSGAQASEGMAAGSGAYTSHGGAGGKGAYSMHGGSLGRGAKTLHGAAVGDGAQTVDAEGNAITAIQLGTGTNTEEGTAKFFDYTMMNADGTIPKERTPNTINRYNVSELPSKSVTYDFSDGVSRFTAVERMTVSVADGVQVITSGSNAGNKYGLAHFDFGSVSDNATRLIVDYDTKYDGGCWDIGLVDLSKRPGTSDKTTYDDTGVAYRAGTRDGTNYWINGTNKYDTSLNDVWVHTHVDIDISEGTLKYEVSVDETLKYTDEISIPDSVETVDGIEVYTWTTETMYVDNIAIKALYNVDENGMYVTPDGEYIYRDGEPVKLGGEVNLSGYYTKTEMDGLLDEKADSNYRSGFKAGVSAQLIDNGGAAIGVGTIASTGGAVGAAAKVSNGGAIGNGAVASDGFAGGKNAKCVDTDGETAIDAIQLGTGTNSTEKTVQAYGYRLMEADGSIPADRLSNYYTRTEIDNRLWEVQISEAEINSDVTLFVEGVDVPDPNPGTVPTTLIWPLNNTIRRYGEISSAQLMIINGPAPSVGAEDSDIDDTLYYGVIEFTSPSTASNITISDIYMTGIDCDNGVFTPQANRRYRLKIIWDGLGYFGEVVGRPI